MSIDINKVIEDRIRDGARKQGEDQADALGKVIQAELDRIGLKPHFDMSMHAFLGHVRNAYEQKVIRERVNAIVDGLIAPKVDGSIKTGSLAWMGGHGIFAGELKAAHAANPVLDEIKAMHETMRKAAAAQVAHAAVFISARTDPLA